jgi:hypothetical protein
MEEHRRRLENYQAARAASGNEAAQFWMDRLRDQSRVVAEKGRLVQEKARLAQQAAAALVLDGP